MRGVRGSEPGRLAQAAFAAACALISGANPSLAQNKGVARGAEMAGYGRLSFAFRDMPKATVSLTPGVLVLNFAEPVAVDLEKIPTELPSYIGAARRDPDGKGLRFALTRPFKPSLKEAGEKIFLDLLPENWRGQPPGLPQEAVDELAARVRDAEDALRKGERRKLAEEVRSMPVRVAVTPTYTRFIFEMPLVVPVSHSIVGARAELKFDAAFKVDVARAKAQAGDAIVSIENVVENGVSKIAIVAPDKVETFAFREDDTYVIDVVPPETRSVPRSPEIAREPAAAAARSAEAVRDAAKPEAKPQPVAAPAQPMAKESAPQANPAVAKQDAAPAVATPVAPLVTQDGDTIKIAFKFAKQPAAAAFDRHGVSTILFETKQPLVAAETPKLLRDIGGEWSFSESSGAPVLRLAFSDRKLVRLAPDGEGWVATIGEKLAGSSDTITPTRALDENGRMIVTASLPRASRAHWLEDSETGERIAVVAAAPPMRSVAKPYRFAEFEFAPTAQGIAVVATADDLTVRSNVDDVVIERGDGLTMSMQIDRPIAASQRAVSSGMFERDAWRDARSGRTRERMREFEHKISEASRGRRAATRVDFTKFLMSNGLLAEARSQLENLVREQPDLARDRAIMLLRFATTVRMARADDARKLMADETMRDDPEAVLWRSVMDAQQRNWARAAAGFAASVATLENYPDDLQAQMRGQWARAAVENRDFVTALAQIDAAEKLDREAVGSDEMALLRARSDEGQGKIEEAAASYEKIFAGADRKAAAEAGLRSATLGLAEKTLTREQAIARMETVSVSFRGPDGVEAEALAALGRLYAEDGRWRDAFTVARRGAEAFPGNENIRALNDEAAAMFEQLFTSGKGDTLDRVQTLALFFDFKELTPSGRQGDVIVRHLAERLVALDLLDSAADLLQHQIDRRVTGPYRAVLAARLAVIYLMNRKPAAALAALKSTRTPDISYNVRRARNLLEARALSDLSRTDLALEIVAAESGPDIDRLAADIQWQGRRWREAGETYERILGDRWKDRAPLDERERADIMRAGVAYSLADESLSLDRLRGKFGLPMSGGPDARAFQVVTSPRSSRPSEFRDLARQAARADTLADFLEEYRKRYPDIPPKAPPRPAPQETAAPQVDPKPDGKPASADAKAEAPSRG